MDWLSSFKEFLGLAAEPRDLTFLQISVRAVIVFLSGLAMVRIGSKRFFAQKTAFDVILGLVLSSMLARAVNGSASFFPTIGGGFVLVGLHRLLAAIAFRSHRFGELVKGTEEVIIENGQLNKAAMKKHYLTERDLFEDLRLQSYENPDEVKWAHLERSGEVSVVPKRR